MHNSFMCRRYKSKPYLDFYDNTTPYNQSWGDYSTEAFTDRAVELINDHHASNPMFMLLSYQAPHNPMQVSAGCCIIHSYGKLVE